MPNLFPPIVRLLDHYEIRLQDDRAIAHGLRAHEQAIVARYHKRFGLSQDAITTTETLLADPATPNGALEGLVSFAAEGGLQSNNLKTALEAIVVGNRPESLRLAALRALSQFPDGIPTIAARRNQLAGDLLAAADDFLIKRAASADD